MLPFRIPTLLSCLLGRAFGRTANVAILVSVSARDLPSVHVLHATLTDICFLTSQWCLSSATLSPTLGAIVEFVAPRPGGFVSLPGFTAASSGRARVVALFCHGVQSVRVLSLSSDR